MNRPGPPDRIDRPPDPLGVGGRRVLVVSPHYDDVPLSLGQSLRCGLLSTAERVEVRVVFGRTNWCVQVHPTPGRAGAITLVRRAEEAVAARVFGYRVRAEPHPEAILRVGSMDPESFRGNEDIGADPLVDRIEALAWAWRTEADALWFPAGVGRHIDHRLVAAAGARLVREGVGAIGFYEERPYTAYLDDEEIEAEVAELGLDLAPHAVSGPIERSTQTRVRRIYRSQMDQYFHEAQDTDRADGRTERVWVPAATSARDPSPRPARSPGVRSDGSAGISDRFSD